MCAGVNVGLGGGGEDMESQAFLLLLYLACGLLLISEAAVYLCKEGPLVEIRKVMLEIGKE